MKHDLDQRIEQHLDLAVPDRVDLYCGKDRGIEIGEYQGANALVADDFKAYMEFRLVHSLPMVTQHESTWHPNTVFNSFKGLRHQVFNYRHQMAKYKRGKEAAEVQNDRILGTVVAVEFEPAPPGGWRLNKAREWNGRQGTKNPGIRVVTNLPKMAVSADRILGSFQTGRQEWTGSIECGAVIAKSSIVLERPHGHAEEDLPSLGPDLQALLKKHTPDDLCEAGYWHLPFIEAPEELLNCFDWETRMFARPFKGRRCIDLLGGINGHVDLKGVGLVNYGGEPTAELVEVLAEGEDPTPALQALETFCGKIGGLADRIAKGASA